MLKCTRQKLPLKSSGTKKYKICLLKDVLFPAKNVIHKRQCNHSIEYFEAMVLPFGLRVNSIITLSFGNTMVLTFVLGIHYSADIMTFLNIAKYK